jgi:hypothetical protein
MDEHIRARFEAIEKLADRLEDRADSSEKVLTQFDKRFDDMKWFLGGAAGLLTIIFSVAALLFGLNFDKQVDQLRNFETDIRADLNKTDKPPKIDILTADASPEPIAGREIAAHAGKEDNNLRLYFNTVLRNTGFGTTDPLSVKLYSKDPIHLGDPSTDERSYQYETYLYKQIDPPMLPGSVSYTYYWYFDLDGQKPAPGPGNYPVLLKVYYGKGRVEQAEITLVIK